MKLLTAVLVLGINLIAAPCQPMTVEQGATGSTVPVRSEPRHHLKFENKYVRVFDVLVPPGDTTLYHLHAQDYLFVMIGAATLKAQVPGGEPTDLIVKDGEVRFSKAPLTHRVTNVGKADFRNITIEILGSPGGSEGATPLDKVPGHTRVLENERVRVERLVLEPGQSTGMHTHGLSELAVAITGGKLQDETSGEKPKISELKAGDFRWHDGPRTHSLKNVGKNRFEAVAIEWK